MMNHHDYDGDDDELDDDNVQKCSALGPHQVRKWLSTSSVLFRTTHFSSLGDWVHLEVGIVIYDKNQAAKLLFYSHLKVVDQPEPAGLGLVAAEKTSKLLW